jgi:hypothetical protein
MIASHVDYTLAPDCRNRYAVEICVKCLQCGRKFLAASPGTMIRPSKAEVRAIEKVAQGNAISQTIEKGE